MSRTHLLDTSVLSQPLRKQPLPAVRDRWVSVGDSRIAISVICEAEVRYGVALSRSPRLASQYDALLRARFPVLDVDEKVADTFALLKATSRKGGRSCSDFDFLIAATAKAHGLVLATLNYRDFHWMQGLAVEDWSR